MFDGRDFINTDDLIKKPTPKPQPKPQPPKPNKSPKDEMDDLIDSIFSPIDFSDSDTSEKLKNKLKERCGYFIKSIA